MFQTEVLNYSPFAMPSAHALVIKFVLYFVALQKKNMEQSLFTYIRVRYCPNIFQYII